MFRNVKLLGQLSDQIWTLHPGLKSGKKEFKVTLIDGAEACVWLIVLHFDSTKKTLLVKQGRNSWEFKKWLRFVLNITIWTKNTMHWDKTKWITMANTFKRMFLARFKTSPNKYCQNESERWTKPVFPNLIWFAAPLLCNEDIWQDP